MDGTAKTLFGEQPKQGEESLFADGSQCVLREAFRSLTLPEPPVDMMLIARPGRAPTTLSAARSGLGRILERWEHVRKEPPARG